MGTDGHHDGAVRFMLVSLWYVRRLENTVAGLEQAAAYWEVEAISRVSVVASELVVRAREAELAVAAIRTEIDVLGSQNLSLAEIRSRLMSLRLDL